MKEASGNLAQMADILAAPAGVVQRALGRRRTDAGGDGGRRRRHHLGGVERHAAGSWRSCAERAAGRRHRRRARRSHFTLLPWMRGGVRRVESHRRSRPRLAMMGRIRNVLRLPLVPLDAEARARGARGARRRRERWPDGRRSPSASLSLADTRRHRARLPAGGRRRWSASCSTPLEQGAVRAAERDADGTWHAVAWVKRGILLGFRAGTHGRHVDSGRRRRRASASSTSTPFRRATSHARWTASASCRAVRRSAAAPTWRRASCACRRCT